MPWAGLGEQDTQDTACGKAAIIPSFGIVLPTVFSLIPDGQDG